MDTSRATEAGSTHYSKASGREVYVDEVFETRPGEWWVSLTYTESAVSRSYTAEQFKTKFQRVKP